MATTTINTTALPTTTIGTNPSRTRTVSRIALGAMNFGTRTDERTSYAVLDRFAEAGGTFIDTSNNYAFWVNGTQGGESEELLGRWLRARGIRDEITIATKVGGRPHTPAMDFSQPLEVQDRRGIREAAARSLERLGRDRIDLYYSHVPDPRTDVAEQVEAFGSLVSDGLVTILGVSNHWMWSVERARALAAAAGAASYDVMQYQYSYFRGRTDQPGLRTPDGQAGVADGNVLSYVQANEGMRLVAYSPLLGGAYTRSDKPLDEVFDHPGTSARRAALGQVARDVGVTPNQVVLAWLLSRTAATIPLVGASSVAQLDESLAASALELTAEQLEVLDAAGA